MKKLTPEQTICRDLWAYPVVDLGKPRARTCCKRHGGWLNFGEIEEEGTDVFLNRPDVIKERDLMMQGYQVEGCKACWDLENSGQQSYRLGPLDFQYHFNNDKGEPVDYTKFRPFEQLIEERESLLYSDMPNKIDIGLGTYCDLKCIYCCSDFSSQWENEDKKYGVIETDPTYPVIFDGMPNKTTLDIWYEKFILWFDSIAEHLERIALMGGEPTHSPFFDSLSKHIAKRLRESSHPNATISIVTNLNWKPHVLDRIIEFRKELPTNIKLKIEISMESVGEQAEYIRNGVNWERFKTNFESISKEKNIDIVLITTINALCIPSLTDYLKFVKEIEILSGRSFPIIPNRLIFPKWLSVNILNSTHKVYVENAINWIKENVANKEQLLEKLIEINLLLDNTQDYELLGYFSKWISVMDNRRNTRFVDTFPELKDIFLTGKQFSKEKYTAEDLKKWSF